jgi:hypothetical protein
MGDRCQGNTFHTMLDLVKSIVNLRNLCNCRRWESLGH